jgi:DNA primase
VILVEGLFDYAVLWQAGFHNVTCSMGTHLNRHQLWQLSDCHRTVYLTFDADSNGSGQQAAQSLADRLREQVWVPVSSHCPRATIRTRGSFRAVMRDSSRRSWRTLSHEVPCNRSADLAELTKFRHAEHHEKQDHLTGHEHSGQALEHPANAPGDDATK